MCKVLIVLSMIGEKLPNQLIFSHFKMKIRHLENDFLQVEMPRNVYMNETVTAKITVTGRNVHRSAEVGLLKSEKKQQRHLSFL